MRTLNWETMILAHRRFYPGLENLILPMLSYPGHVRAKYIGCIGTHAHGRQVMSLLCQSEVIITCCIPAYSGTSGSLFLRIKGGI